MPAALTSISTSPGPGSGTGLVPARAPRDRPRPSLRSRSWSLAASASLVRWGRRSSGARMLHRAKKASWISTICQPEEEGLRAWQDLSKLFGRRADSAHRRSQGRDRARGGDARRQAILEQRRGGGLQALGADLANSVPLGKSRLSVNSFLGVLALGFQVIQSSGSEWPVHSV